MARPDNGNFGSEKKMTRQNFKAAPHDRNEADMDAPPQGGFLFVESTGQKTKQNRHQLRKMRGHVMLNYLERKDVDREEVEANKPTRMSFKHSHAGGQKHGVTGGQKMKFRMKSGELEQRLPYRYRKGKRSEGRKNATEGDEVLKSAELTISSLSNRRRITAESGFVPGMPVTWLGSKKLDVFRVLPIQLDEADEASLQIFQQYERYPWCPINGQNGWGPFALSDQLVFHATMFSWGMHFRNRRPIPDPQEEMKTLQHKVAAISLINERISDSTRAVDDETVAAVAALTNIALVIDAYPEASKHMAGLWAIVEMRGGLLSLSSSVQQHLQRLISWNDLIYSEVFDEKLRFPPIEVWDESWRDLQRRALPGSLPDLSRAELRAAGVPRHEVLRLLHDIRDLCDAELMSPLRVIDDEGRMKRGDMFHRVERKLRIIIQDSTGAGRNRWDATVWRVVSLAALIFTHHNLRGNPLKYRHFNVVSMQLYDTLLTMSEDLTELDFAPALLVWVLSTGAIVTTPMGIVQTSFISMLGKVCGRYGLTDFESFRWTLRQFLWTGEADEARYWRLWKELEPSLQSLVVIDASSRT